MAKFTASLAFDINNPQFLQYIANISDGTISSNRTSTYFRASAVVDGVPTFIDVYGSGFLYASDGTPFFGEINRVVGNVGGQKAFELGDVALDIFPTVASWADQTPEQILAQIFEGNDTIRTSGAADVISGFAGADRLYGMGGNDTYYVDQMGDIVYEASGQGSDTVYAASTYKLRPGQHIEFLAAADAGSTAKLNLTGNELVNTLKGNNGSNVLNGGEGADRLYGFSGNDTYVVDNTGDKVFEAVGRGTADTVKTTVSFTLGAGQEIERLWALSVTDTSAMTLTGNEFANDIRGNNGINNLKGGLGNDRLSGFGGADNFVFDKAIGATNVDRIVDFELDVDKIRLDDAIFSALNVGGMSAQEFADHFTYSTTSGYLSYDADGPGGSKAVRFAMLENKAGIDAGDFIVF